VNASWRKKCKRRTTTASSGLTASFALPSSVDADKTSAEYKDGVLTLSMPKREEAKRKTIKIQTSGEPKQVAAGANR